MGQTSDQEAVEFTNFRIFEDGRIERFFGEETVPPSPESEGVRSKDIVISPESGLSARLFLPQISDPTRKLPFLVFYHGGAFCAQSPFSPLYTNHATSLAAEANVVVLSVHYRRPPEHPLPIAYEDAWDAIQWATAHSDGNGPESWLNRYADFQRVFVGGASAGANIAHNVVLRAGVDGLSGPRIVGMVLFHPFFGNDKPDKLLEIIFPTCDGLNDPRVNPGSDPNLGRMGCSRVLVLVAENDFLSDRGWGYYEALKKSGWSGVVEIVETEGEGHVFHLFNPESVKAQDLTKRAAAFLNLA